MPLPSSSTPFGSRPHKNRVRHTYRAPKNESLLFPTHVGRQPSTTTAIAAPSTTNLPSVSAAAATTSQNSSSTLSAAGLKTMTMTAPVQPSPASTCSKPPQPAPRPLLSTPTSSLPWQSNQNHAAASSSESGAQAPFDIVFIGEKAHCFVCRAAVPVGIRNFRTHVNGRRHLMNARRFTTYEEKHRQRALYVQEMEKAKAAGWLEGGPEAPAGGKGRGRIEREREREREKTEWRRVGSVGVEAVPPGGGGSTAGTSRRDVRFRTAVGGSTVSYVIDGGRVREVTQTERAGNSMMPENKMESTHADAVTADIAITTTSSETTAKDAGSSYCGLSDEPSATASVQNESASDAGDDTDGICEDVAALVIRATDARKFSKRGASSLAVDSSTGNDTPGGEDCTPCGSIDKPHGDVNAPSSKSDAQRDEVGTPCNDTETTRIIADMQAHGEILQRNREGGQWEKSSEDGVTSLDGEGQGAIVSEEGAESPHGICTLPVAKLSAAIKDISSTEKGQEMSRVPSPCTKLPTFPSTPYQLPAEEDIANISAGSTAADEKTASPISNAADTATTAIATPPGSTTAKGAVEGSDERESEETNEQKEEEGEDDSKVVLFHPGLRIVRRQRAMCRRRMSARERAIARREVLMAAFGTRGRRSAIGRGGSSDRSDRGQMVENMGFQGFDACIAGEETDDFVEWREWDGSVGERQHELGDERGDGEGGATDTAVDGDREVREGAELGDDRVGDVNGGGPMILTQVRWFTTGWTWLEEDDGVEDGGSS